MRVERSRTALLAWASAGLLITWGGLWLAGGVRGLTVHLLLAAAFALIVIWGLLRAI
jgi:hypothetical protein